MRSIEFRAWDPQTKTMYYDIMPRGAAWNEILSHGGEGMEYIGLKDKNGVKIWEGDLITGAHLPWPMTVVYLDDRASFGYEKLRPATKDQKAGGTFSTFEDDMNMTTRDAPDGVFDHLKVAGNKYENPGLLDG